MIPCRGGGLAGAPGILPVVWFSCIQGGLGSAEEAAPSLGPRVMSADPLAPFWEGTAEDSGGGIGSVHMVSCPPPPDSSWALLHLSTARNK